MHGILPTKCSRLEVNPSLWQLRISTSWPVYRGVVPLSHYQDPPVGVNPWGIIFADSIEMDLSRAGMVRSIFEMLLTSPWGLFYSPLLDWLVAQLFIWPTGLICSMPWNALNQRCSAGVTQYSLWWKNNWPRWKAENPRISTIVLFWPLSPWKISHWCNCSTFHLVYLHWLSHGCRDGLNLWPDMLVSPRFLSLIPSVSGSTVRR